MQPYQPNQPSLLSPTLSQAIQAARSWVAENAADKPGYLGAYIGGSAPTLSPEDRLPAGSDTDVYLVTSDPTPPPKPSSLPPTSAKLPATATLPSSTPNSPHPRSLILFTSLPPPVLS